MTCRESSAVACKCMVKCQDVPNVRVVNDTYNVMRIRLEHLPMPFVKKLSCKMWKLSLQVSLVKILAEVLSMSPIEKCC
ncbi:hypothetical protein Bca4012_009161 [Brassica carinata]